ncbi:hypothetical protein QL285_014633 [Trifolium repens]|nr:hypothetical protein QL285_014633 [Trifolium repens]
MFYVSQSRPINDVTFLLANFAKIIEEPTRRINIGGFVIFLGRALDPHTPLSRIVLYGGIQPMDITFCFNNHLIGNLGPNQFQLLINFESVHHFTMPNNDRTSVHDKQNWLYDFEGQDETDPKSPPLCYYILGVAPPTFPADSTIVPPPQVDHGAAIATLRTELATLRTDFHNFMDLIIPQLDRCLEQILGIRQHLPPADKPLSG